jgi:hypothetical protein
MRVRFSKKLYFEARPARWRRSGCRCWFLALKENSGFISGVQFARRRRSVSSIVAAFLAIAAIAVAVYLVTPFVFVQPTEGDTDRWNEQIKLAAGSIDRIAVAMVILGFLQPSLASGAFRLEAGVATLVWALVGVALHVVAQAVLLLIRPKT